MVGALSSMVEPRPSILLASATRGYSMGKKEWQLGSHFFDTWNDDRMEARAMNGIRWKKKRLARRGRGGFLVFKHGGQYEDNFQDVKTNNPGDGKRFLKLLEKLVKERQDLAERVMIMRLHLYAKWMKKCDHVEIYKEISDENLELMCERLMETMIWLADR